MVHGLETIKSMNQDRRTEQTRSRLTEVDNLQRKLLPCHADAQYMAGQHLEVWNGRTPSRDPSFMVIVGLGEVGGVLCYHLQAGRVPEGHPWLTVPAGIFDSAYGVRILSRD